MNERTQCLGPTSPQILLGAEGDAGEAGAQHGNAVECLELIVRMFLLEDGESEPMGDTSNRQVALSVRTRPRKGLMLVTGERAAKGEHDKSLRGSGFIRDLYIYMVVERWLGG